MLSTFYVLGFSLFVVGVGFYVVFSRKLSEDLRSGAIPVRVE